MKGIDSLLATEKNTVPHQIKGHLGEKDHVVGAQNHTGEYQVN